MSLHDKHTDRKTLLTEQLCLANIYPKSSLTVYMFRVPCGDFFTPKVFAPNIFVNCGYKVIEKFADRYDGAGPVIMAGQLYRI